MSIIADGAPSMQWAALAKQKLEQIKESGTPAKTLVINGYTIRVSQLDGLGKIHITEPIRLLKSWGINGFPSGPGVLGTGDTAARSAPGPVPHRPTWVAVSAGRSHALGINSDSTLWAWGDNSNGSLGVGDVVDRLKPSAVGGGWAAVSAGHYFSLGIKVDGTLWAWGGNYVGDPPINSYTPAMLSPEKWDVISAALDTSLGIKADGSLWDLQMGLGVAIGTTAPTPIDAGPWRTVSVGGFGHQLGIKTDGTLWAWTHGSTNIVSLGALGLGYLGGTTSVPTPTQVGGTWLATQAGGAHSLGIKSDGSLWAWGSNLHGQLGLGDTTNRLTPQLVDAGPWIAISAGDEQSTGIKADGTLWQWGSNGAFYWSTPQQIDSGATWRAVSTSYAYYSLAISGWAGPPDYVRAKQAQGTV